MKPVLIVATILLLRPSVLPAPLAEDCFIACMERSGCWSGGSVSNPSYCHDMPELCTIQCRGKSNNPWGAIAYSRQDETSGWSFEQVDKATAERIAMQACNKEGGAKCAVEATFSNTCGAVAVDGKIVGWGTGASKGDAGRRAATECSNAGGKKCKVEASVCSVPNTGSSGGTAPPAPRAVSWGAIAYSSKDMGAGYSQGKNDRAAAEKEAMSICAQRGKGCVLETAFNKQCGALAADRDFIGIATSADQQAALKQAMDKCKSAGGTRCAPHILFCSL